MTSRARNGLAVLLWVGLAAGCGGNSSGESGKDSGPDGAQVPSTGGGGAVTSDGAVASGGVTGTGGNTLACSGFTTLAGGYVKSGALHGYAWLSKDAYPATTISPADFSALTAGSPLCVSGSVAHGLNWDAWMELGISINQAPGGATSGTYVPASSGININLSNPGGSRLRVMLIGPNGASDPNDNWCAPIVASGGFIPWSQFNTKCADNSGTPYAGQALQSIAVMVPDNNTTATPFNFCVLCLAESGAPSGSGGTDGGMSTGGTGGTDGGMSTGGTGGTDAPSTTPGGTPTDGSSNAAPADAAGTVGSSGDLVSVTSASGVETSAYTLTGTVASGVTVLHLQYDGATVDVTPVGDAFSTPITLQPGVNGIDLTVDGPSGPLQPLHVVVVFATHNPSSIDLINAALTNGSITAEQALEYQIFTIFNDPRLPAELTGDDSFLAAEEDIISAVLAAVPTLSDAAKDIIGPFLTPDYFEGSAYQQRHGSGAAGPTSTPHGATICNVLTGGVDCIVSSNWATVEGTNIRVWYDKTRSATTVPGKSYDWTWDLAAAEEVRSVIESPGTGAWDILTPIMGAKPLANTATWSTDGKLDILLTDMGIDGLTTSNFTFSNQQVPVFIRLNRNKAARDIVGASIHEFMHAIQFALPLAGADLMAYPAFADGIATWATNRVRKDNNWEHQYVPSYLQNTECSLDKDPCGSTPQFRYGTWLFFLYLSEHRGDAIMGKLWNAAATEKDQLKILRSTIGDDLDAMWADFGGKLWNGKPEKYFNKLDKIPDQPPIAKGFDVPIALKGTDEEANGYGIRTFPVNIAAFSTRYVRLVFDVKLVVPDPGVRTLAFFNGMGFERTQKQTDMVKDNVKRGLPPLAPVTCPAILPLSDPNKAKKAHLWFALKQDDSWQVPSEFLPTSGKGYKIQCQDDTSGVYNEIVLMASYTDETDKKPFHCTGGDPALIYSSSFCAGANGTASFEGSLANWDLSLTGKRTLNTTDFIWKRTGDTVMSLVGGGYWVCGSTLSLKSGNITMTAQNTLASYPPPEYVFTTCPVDGSLQKPALAGGSQIELYDLGSYTQPDGKSYSHFYVFPGFDSCNISHCDETEYVFEGTCSQESLFPDDFSLRTFAWGDDPAGYPIPPNGTLSGDGKSLASTLNGSGKWSVSPLR